MRHYGMMLRVAAAQATLDLFTVQPFKFGTSDCVQMIARHLEQLGHQPNLQRGGRYRSAQGARAALRRAGFSSIDDALTALGLEPIAPAAALIGDIVKLEGEAPFGGFAVYVGNGRIVGFHEDREGAVVLQPSKPMLSAWRAEPTRSLLEAYATARADSSARIVRVAE